MDINTYIKDIDERYRYSETEEGLIINKLLSLYNEEKNKNKELSKSFRELQNELNTIIDNSRRDELTGLHNRKAIRPYFNDNLTNGSNLTLITIDLDHFKSINDTYGHNVGDDVLRIVSESLIRTFKKKDLIVRDGGDEFLVVVKDFDLDSLKYRVEVMSTYISECIHKELDSLKDELGRSIERPYDYTISYGIREMNTMSLGDINNDELFDEWYREEKEYADKSAYVMKAEHHATRR